MLIDTSNLRSQQPWLSIWAWCKTDIYRHRGMPWYTYLCESFLWLNGNMCTWKRSQDSQRKFEFFVPHLVLLANYHFLRLFIMRIPDHFCSLVLTWQDAHWCMAWDQFCGLHWPGRQEQSLHVCERFREQFIWRRAHHFSKCQSCEACYAQLHSLQCPSSLVLVLKVDS